MTPADDHSGSGADVPQLPESIWRSAFADYRQALAGASEVADAVHFFTFWGIAAARLQRRVEFFLGMPIYANVYLLSVGPTGDRKTTGMRHGGPLLPTDGSVRVARGLGSSEAFLDWMAEAEGPASHLVYLDEIANLLIRGSWAGSTLLPMLTECFDAPPVYELRFRKNPISVMEPTVTLHAGSTPTWFWKNVREEHFQGGFANRVLYGVGMPTAPIALPRRPDAGALQAVKRHLDRLGQVAGEGQLTPDAEGLYRDFDARWRQESPAFAEMTALATKRVPTYVVKLCLAYAALECTFPRITGDQMQAAIAAGRWAAACAEWLCQQRTSDSIQSKCERAVLDALRSEELPPFRIHRKIGGKRFTAEELNRALKALELVGSIRPVGQGKRGAIVYGLQRGAEPGSGFVG